MRERTSLVATVVAFACIYFQKLSAARARLSLIDAKCGPCSKRTRQLQVCGEVVVLLPRPSHMPKDSCSETRLMLHLLRTFKRLVLANIAAFDLQNTAAVSPAQCDAVAVRSRQANSLVGQMLLTFRL